MPPKTNQARAWGTRYDTLPSSPPASPGAKRDETQLVLQESSPSPESQDTHKEDKQPHDASIFVGSLPSNVDQAELTRLLASHLSEHAEIKNIKVIRDSKGGVCAFIQCEDAASASIFLKNLQNSSPRPFLGRMLRYEPARAFRTLLISYRRPFQIMTPEGPSRISVRNMPEVPLDLPNAIRIWKPRNTKYHRIVYNGEAIEAEKFSRSLTKGEATLNEEAVYLQPLKFDAESLVKIAGYFGPLENVSRLGGGHELVKAPKNGIIGPECYPLPHNAVRSEEMDDSCWEVKWNHRDDCVAALMVLRRVSYLSISWAHQPQIQHPVQRAHSHIQDCQSMDNTASRTQIKVDRFQPYSSHSPNPRTGLTSFSSEPSPPLHSLRQNVASDDKGRTMLKSTAVFDDEIESWVEPVTPPSLAPGPANDSSDVGSKPTRIDWADSDFSSFIDSEYDSKLDWSVWGETSFERDMVKAPSIIASQSVCEVSAPQRVRHSPPLLQGDKVPTPGLAMSPPTPRTISSQAPVTPANQFFGPPFSSFRSSENVPESSDSASLSSREFDPTALFVGGLETLGPSAWTQEKVEALFGRFRGLSHVKFVCPPNSHAAFAFIKYDNTESPAQAIIQEHNRVYAGRALKVQLRDLNPPRSPWKPSRGRSRFTHYPQSRKVMLSSRHLSYVPKREGLSPRQNLSENSANSTPVFSPNAPAEKFESSKDESSPFNGQQKDGHEDRGLEDTQGEKYREWYDVPGAGSESAGASGGSGGPSLVAPVLPYPVPPGYYPMSWIPLPHAQAGHYQMSYYGPYTAYPPGLPMPPHPTTPPDTSGPTTGTIPWPNVMYTPYAPYFGPPRLAMDQQGPPQPVLGPQFTQPSQAPLAPSGFIQNDQGTLIAVYSPDALDQYMSGQGNGSSGGSNPSTSMQSLNSSSVWPSMQAVNGPVPTLSVPPQTSNNPHLLHPVPVTHPFWNPLPPLLPPIPSGIITGPATPTYNIHAATRTGEPHDHLEMNSPLAKKQGGSRRNLHPTQNGNRNSRSNNHPRNGRGHIHNQNLTGNTEGVNSHYRNPQFGNTSDWNQYTRR